MKRYSVPVALLVLVLAVPSLADDPPTGRFTPVRGITADRVAAASASERIHVGDIALQLGERSFHFDLFCAGANATLACDVRSTEGAVVGIARAMEVLAGNVWLSVERTGSGAASWRNMRVSVPGTVLHFGGQDLGE